jgi:hypothetical protein
MTKYTDNPNSYYTPGNPKRKRVITADWLDKVIRKAFTDQDIINKLKNMEDKELLQVIQRHIPKESDIKGESSLTIILSNQNMIPKELPVHHEVLTDGNDEDE